MSKTIPEKVPPVIVNTETGYKGKRNNHKGGTYTKKTSFSRSGLSAPPRDCKELCMMSEHLQTPKSSLSRQKKSRPMQEGPAKRHKASGLPSKRWRTSSSPSL